MIADCVPDSVMRIKVASPCQPSVVDGAMDRDCFVACVTNQRAPALRPGQIVAAAKLSSHRLMRASGLLRAEMQRPDLPRTLFPRPEPGRDGLPEAQNPDPQASGPNLSGLAEKGRRRMRRVPATTMPKLLHRSRLRCPLKATGSSVCCRAGNGFQYPKQAVRCVFRTCGSPGRWRTSATAAAALPPAYAPRPRP